MTNMIWDGDHQLVVASEIIDHELRIEEVVEYYQTTWIYRSLLKESAHDPFEMVGGTPTRLAWLANALEALHGRMVRELGEERADLIAARTSMDLILAG